MWGWGRGHAGLTSGEFPLEEVRGRGRPGGHPARKSPRVLGTQTPARLRPLPPPFPSGLVFLGKPEAPLYQSTEERGVKGTGKGTSDPPASLDNLGLSAPGVPFLESI